MNKLIVAMVAVFSTVSLVAMEQQMAMTISETENSNFLRHLGMATGFGKKMIVENKIIENNPIHKALIKLSNDLEKSDSNLLKMIVCEKLESRIQMFQQVESEPLVQFAKNQFEQKAGDYEEAKKYLIRSRQLLAALKLHQIQPAYSKAWIGEIQTQDRIDFMNRNEAYPVDENAIKDYISFFIYQLVFASQLS